MVDANGTVSIRRAVLADRARIVPLFGAYRQFYERPSDPDRESRFLAGRLERGEAIVFLAEAGGEAIGFTLLYPSFSSISLRRIYVLNDLFVRPEQRRRGVGAALLGAAREFARADGADYLTLETARDNPAQRLYESLGWRQDREFLHYELRL
ncbi:MAG TPA: GNAT family N-acetyltransferase [Thermoplasmata archaeon]|nr:GNAT family N-acetyltransferase [Thermoplasmata archaeon]